MYNNEDWQPGMQYLILCQIRRKTDDSAALSDFLQSDLQSKTPNKATISWLCLPVLVSAWWKNCLSTSLSSLLLLCFLCLSWLVSFCFWFSWLGPMCVFRALVVVCNKSHINAACCHMRDQSTTSNKEQMDTRVCLLEKYFPLMLQTPLLLSEREKECVL